MQILTFPNNVLRKVATDYLLNKESEKKAISHLIKEMAVAMYEHNGMGLAAPQVGVSKRLFVIDVEQKTERDEDGEIISRIPGKLLVFINPKIKEKEGTAFYEEGCLSVPGVYEEVKRAEKITIEYYDENFDRKELKTDGVLAIVIQHENDHLDGKLFIDRLPMVKRTIVKNRLLKGKNL